MGVAQYAELRHEALHEWASTKLTRLSKATAGPDVAVIAPLESAPAALQASADQVGRIQQLQLKLSEIRGAAAPLAASVKADNGTSARTDTVKGKGPPAVQVRLEVPCPKWARLAAPKANAQLAVTFGELCGIHSAAA